MKIIDKITTTVNNDKIIIEENNNSSSKRLFRWYWKFYNKFAFVLSTFKQQYLKFVLPIVDVYHSKLLILFTMILSTFVFFLYQRTLYQHNNVFLSTKQIKQSIVQLRINNFLNFILKIISFLTLKIYTPTLDKILKIKMGNINNLTAWPTTIMFIFFNSWLKHWTNIIISTEEHIWIKKYVFFMVQFLIILFIFFISRIWWKLWSSLLISIVMTIGMLLFNKTDNKSKKFTNTKNKHTEITNNSLLSFIDTTFSFGIIYNFSTTPLIIDFYNNKIIKEYNLLILKLVPLIIYLSIFCLFIRTITDLIFSKKNNTINTLLWLFNNTGQHIPWFFSVSKAPIILLEEKKILTVGYSFITFCLKVLIMLKYTHLWYTIFFNPTIELNVIGQIWLIFIIIIQTNKIIYNLYNELKYKWMFMKECQKKQ